MSQLEVTMKKLRAQLRAARRPIVAWSSGVDSMAMLHMARKIIPWIPVLFLREHFQTHKLEFAQRIIAEWDLQVLTLPCVQKDIVMKGDEVEIYKSYPLGGQDSLVVPLGINRDFDEANFKCALDLVKKPVAGLDGYQFPWDLVLHGQRADDVDPLHGALTLADPVREIGQTTVYYPLHNWTRDEVVEYIRAHDVPVETRRYDVAHDYQEFADKTYNLDYLDICTRCITAGGQGVQRVRCPKLQADVDTIAIPDRRAEWRARFELPEAA